MSIIQEQWNVAKNGTTFPEAISPKSTKKAWWICNHGHEWEARIDSRTAGNGCPVCANKIILSGINDLLTLNPKLGIEWNYNKNTINPNQIAFNFSKKVWWTCSKSHEWEATVASRNSGGNGCPYCSGNKVLRGFNDLEFLNPELAKEWHPSRNIINAYESSLTSGVKRWWLGKCGHEWSAIVANRVKHNYGCPFCAGQKVLVGFNDLSYKNKALAEEWNHSKNSGTPQEYTSCSQQRVWWICKEGHEWQSSIANRHRLKRACPTCAKSGFKSDELSVIYLIENHTLQARKIGIANISSNRIDTWVKSGWSKIYISHELNGNNIRNIETYIKRWLRLELNLKPVLNRSQMGWQAGNTETFSQDFVSNEEIISKIKSLY